MVYLAHSSASAAKLCACGSSARAYLCHTLWFGATFKDAIDAHFTKGWMLSGEAWSGRIFLRALDETRGTAIVERYSFKGPVYLWWTPENVDEACPYPTVDWITLHEESTAPLAPPQRSETPAQRSGAGRRHIQLQPFEVGCSLIMH